MHEKITAAQEQLNDQVDQLNAILENIYEIKDEECLANILKDLTKAVDSVRWTWATVYWASKRGTD